MPKLTSAPLFAIEVRLKDRPPVHPDDDNEPRIFTILGTEPRLVGPPPDLALEMVCEILHAEYMTEWEGEHRIADAENGPSPEDVPHPCMTVETLKDLYHVTASRTFVYRLERI